MDIAKLGIAVDSSDVKKTDKQLGKLSGSARKAETATQRFSKVAKVGLAAVATASVGAAAALSKMVADASDASREIRNLSNVAQATPESFQRMAYGAEQFGIEQQKLADILKDTNDRIGDFIQTGGGPMRDFFENIAPKVGVTADQFARLSGPEALQLYVQSLQDAGVSQKDMTFYMEAMASDATALLPLLRDNGDMLKEFGDEAERTGLVLGAMDMAKLQEADKAIRDIKYQFEGLRNYIAIEAAPVVTAFSESFVDIVARGEDMETAVEEAFNNIISAAGFVADSVEGVKRTFEVTGSFAAVAFLGIERAALALADGIINGPVEAAQELIELLNHVPGIDIEPPGLSGIGETIRDEIKITEAAISAGMENIEAILLKPMPSTTFEKFVEDARNTAEEAVKQTKKVVSKDPIKINTSYLDQMPSASDVESLSEKQKQYNRMIRDLRTEEEVLTDQMRERLRLMDEMAPKGQRSNIAGRIADAATTDAPTSPGLDAEVGGAFSELNRIAEAEEKLNDWYNTQLEMVNQFRSERADLNATWDEQERELARQHSDKLQDIERAREMAQIAAAGQTFGHLTDMTREFAGEQSGIYKAMFATQKAFAIAESIIAIQAGIAKAANNPFPANLAAMASVAAATAGIVSNIQSVSGMAHDGIDSVPEDGTWNLQKGERVVTSETSAKLDKKLDSMNGGSGVTVNLYEDDSKAGQVEQTQRNGTNEVNVFVSDIMSEGPRAKAMQSAYGLQRRGK